MKLFSSRFNLLLVCFLYIALLFISKPAISQNLWLPISSPLEPIHYVTNINDTLYGNFISQGKWTIKRKQGNLWLSLPPINLDAQDSPRFTERYKGETYACTFNKLYKFSNGSWSTVATGYFEALLVYNGLLYIFNFQGGYITMQTYNGSTLAAVTTSGGGTVALTGFLHIAQVLNGKIYLGGQFSFHQAGGTSTIKQSPNYVTWDGIQWDTACVSCSTLNYYNSNAGSGVAELNGNMYFFFSPQISSGKKGKVYKVTNMGTTLLDSINVPQYNTSDTVFNLTPPVFHDSTIYSIFSIQYAPNLFYDIIYKLENDIWESTGDTLARWPSIAPNPPLPSSIPTFPERLTSCNQKLYAFGANNSQISYVHVLDSASHVITVSVSDTRSDSCAIDSTHAFLKRSIQGPGYTYYSSSKGPRQILLPGNQSPVLKVNKRVPTYYQNLACSDSIITVNMSASNTGTADFYLKPLAELYDVSSKVVGSTGSRARYGFNQTYFLTITNEGTEPLTNISLEFNHPLNSTFVSSSESPTLNTAGQVNFTVDSLFIQQQKTIEVTLKNTTALPFGDSIDFALSTSLPVTDHYLPNNIDTLTQRVVGAVDPNNKLVNKEQLGQWGGDLIYQINFQNKGNDTAYKVVLIDSLPPELKPETFTFLASSHSAEISIVDGLLSFEFYNILLPDSATNQNKSKGYVQFSIEMDDQLAATDTIKNRAHIYFDFQKPIITNYAKTYFVQDFGLPENAQKSFAVHPNPSHGAIIISSKTPGTLSLYNSLGQEVWHGFIGKEPFSINLSHLPAGLYFMVDDAGMSQKIIRTKN